MSYKKIIFGLLAVVVFAGTGFSADKYELDPAHTTIGFSVKHMVLATVRGHFNEYDTNILFDENDITKSSVSATIKVASINTDNQKRDGHLKSPDFFNVEKYPDILFESKHIEKKDDGYVVIGNFTMRGVTKVIELPFEVVGSLDDPWGNHRVGIEASAKINRQDYGVSWNKVLDNGGLVASDIVNLEIHAELVKKTEKLMTK